MFPCVVGNEEEEEEEEVFPRGCADVSLSRVSEYSVVRERGEERRQKLLEIEVKPVRPIFFSNNDTDEGNHDHCKEFQALPR